MSKTFARTSTVPRPQPRKEKQLKTFWIGRNIVVEQIFIFWGCSLMHWINETLSSRFKVGDVVVHMFRIKNKAVPKQLIGKIVGVQHTADQPHFYDCLEDWKSGDQVQGLTLWNSRETPQFGCSATKTWTTNSGRVVLADDAQLAQFRASSQQNLIKLEPLDRLPSNWGLS